MNGNDLTLETTSGVCTRSLVTAILESRRAYQLALALARQVLLTGQDLKWEESAALKDQGQDPTPARRMERARTTDTRFAMRRRTPRHGLRLVLPNHFDSPLVMPADSKYTSVGDSADEQPDDRRELDAGQGNRPRDAGND